VTLSQQMKGKRPLRTNFDPKVSSVHVVTEEEVTGCRRVSADLEELHQVEL
jgi:hypothetical protein